jgi:hypothetical protein
MDDTRLLRPCIKRVELGESIGNIRDTRPTGLGLGETPCPCRSAWATTRSATGQVRQTESQDPCNRMGPSALKWVTEVKSGVAIHADARGVIRVAYERHTPGGATLTRPPPVCVSMWPRLTGYTCSRPERRTRAAPSSAVALGRRRPRPEDGHHTSTEGWLFWPA